MQQRLIAFCLSVGFALLDTHARTEEIDPRPLLSMSVGESGCLSSWLTLGPLPASEIDKVEGNALFDTPPVAGNLFLNKTWIASHFSSSDIDFAAKRQSAVVLFVRIASDGDQTIWMSTGSNGPIQARLNKSLVLSRTSPRKNFPDTDLTSLSLIKGNNDLFIVLKNLDVQGLRAVVRLMNEDFSPADNIRVLLPGAPDDGTEVLEKKGTLRLLRSVFLSKKNVAVRAVLAFPGGRPVIDKTSILAALKTKEGAVLSERTVDVQNPAESQTPIGEFIVEGDSLPVEITAVTAGAHFARRLGFHLHDVLRLGDAEADLLSATSAGYVEKTTSESLSWRIAHLTALIEAGDEDFMYIDREIRDTVRMARSLKEGKDPYFNRNNQLQRRGYRSSLDGSLQPYVLYVPPGWKEEGDNRFGIIVALHGLNSTPMRTVQTVFGIPMMEGESKQQQDRYPRPIGTAPMFVLAPFGFGNSGYRAFGETDVLNVLRQTESRYRIHPKRIYMTGASMGGIGAASLPLHFPDKFAAAAPLCGYHSMFLFRGVLGKSLLPFERFLLESFSNARWAANGRYVPMHIVHGLKDNPGQSRVLADSYRNLSYPVAYKTLDLGHNVWDETYQKGRIFQHFAAYRKEDHPRQVTFHTPTLRYSSSYYIQIDEMENYGQWATVDADWQKNNTIVIRTANLSRMTVHNDALLQGGGPLTALIDNTSIPLPSERPSWSLVKQENKWVLSDVPVESLGPIKRSGLSGPMEDSLFDPLLFVFGTKNKAEETLSKRLIEEMRNNKSGITIHWPVKADRDVTDADISSKSIVIVGTPSGNSLLKRIEKDLPIQVSGNAVVAGNETWRGRAPAAAFIYPNPLNPNRYVTVYTGVSLEALFYVNHLPEMRPDYIVFDGPTWETKGGRILDSRSILAAGFFNRTWSMLQKAGLPELKAMR